MLLKSPIGNMSFKKTVILRICISVFVILIGMKCLLLVLLNQVGSLQSLIKPFGISLINLDFMRGFYTGFGSALIVAGIVLIIENVILLKNPEKFKKAEIKYLDERNRFISNVTLSTTAYIFLIALSTAVIISGMFNLTVFLTLLCTLFSYLIICLIIYAIVKATN